MPNKFLVSGSPNDYELIETHCHKYSFVFFHVIVIQLEAWLIDKLKIL